MGFRHILAEDFAGLVIVQLRENLDDFERSYAEAKSLLDAHPDLAGIYNIGAGNRASVGREWPGRRDGVHRV